ncbi:Appr-1-p processing protein, partial [Parabacteroides distasonis]|nr:Appr-1-p processing protein [Parabacteroides distasonis]
DKWINKSEMDYIEKGLNQLVELLPKLNINSIAIPPLGCGNGGLKWSEVKTLILEKLGDLKEKYDFYIYEPSKNYVATSKTAPQLSLSALVLMSIKIGLNKFNTLRLQKTAYFMNIFLQENYFKFQKHKFGPYDNSIAIISKNIKEFQNYYNTKNTKDAYKIAYNIIISNKSDLKLKTLEPALKKAIEYV